MKVALVSLHSFYNPGGVKRHIFGLHNEYKRRGIDSKIIAPRRKRSENYGSDVILLGTSFPFPFGGSRSDFSVNFNPLAVNETLEKEKFDVFHFHNFALPASLQFLISPQANGVLNILTFHSSMEGSQAYKNFPEIFYPIKKIVDWKIDGVIGVAPFILTKYFDDFPRPKIYIPNGIDLDQFNPQVPPIKKIAKKGKITILFLGRLDRRKGLIYLLRAYKALCRRFDNLQLVVVGDGPEKNRGLDYVKTNRLPGVLFTGAVKENKVPSYYRACDIYCSPAISGESFGIVLIEAMASGKPVVAFANEGYLQVLGKGKASDFLAKPKQWRTLAQKLEILINDKNRRNELGQWGIAEARQYGWDKIAGRVLDFYDTCRTGKTKP